MTISSPKKSFLAGLLVLMAAAAMPLSAQSTAAPPAAMSAPQNFHFEVVTVRAHPFNGDEPSNRRMLPGGRFVATATNVRTLIRIAFGTDNIRTPGGTGWLDSQSFDITGTIAGHAEVTTPAQFQQLILSLLEDRFGLKFHREKKEGPVYWLEVDKPGKLGAGLKPSTPDSKPDMSNNSNGSRAQMKVGKAAMPDIAAILRRQAGRPVEDHTGLTGTYDFQIEWSPEETPDSTDPSLNTVLKEQLGLKLQPAKGSIEAVVIDQIAQPTAN